jgi:hypothetical protein
VHKQTVVACVRIAGNGAASQEIRTFGTTTSELLALADWLESFGVKHVAMRVKGSYLQAQFHHLRARRGAKKAIIAVATSMLTAIWHMLRNGTEWRELGAAYFDRTDAKRTATRLIRRLQQIGCAVQVTSEARPA